VAALAKFWLSAKHNILWLVGAVILVWILVTVHDADVRKKAILKLQRQQLDKQVQDHEALSTKLQGQDEALNQQVDDLKQSQTALDRQIALNLAQTLPCHLSHQGLVLVLDAHN